MSFPSVNFKTLMIPCLTHAQITQIHQGSLSLISEMGFKLGLQVICFQYFEGILVRNKLRSSQNTMCLGANEIWEEHETGVSFWVCYVLYSGKQLNFVCIVFS
jgi:hypothetical protein